MASAVSLEYLTSLEGAPNGLATLDGSGKIPVSQLPPTAVETYKGQFATSAALIAAYPSGSIADYAYVTATNSYWYFNSALATPAWVDEHITAAAYTALSAAAKGAVPYNIVP